LALPPLTLTVPFALKQQCGENAERALNRANADLEATRQNAQEAGHTSTFHATLNKSAFFDNFYTPGFVFVTLNVILVLTGVVSSIFVLSSFILSVSIFSNSLSPFPRRTGIISIYNSSHSPALRHC
jgi:hypothetical protein